MLRKAVVLVCYGYAQHPGGVLREAVLVVVLERAGERELAVPSIRNLRDIAVDVNNCSSLLLFKNYYFT